MQADYGLKTSVSPPFLPDHPDVRNDILDYFFEVERFDSELGGILSFLEERDQLANTIVIVTSDNGMPFPRAKADLYDYGSRVPLAIHWPERIPGGRVVNDFVSLVDIAPTILEAAGLEPIPDMTGRSLLGVLTSGMEGRVDSSRDHVILARERHTPWRAGRVWIPDARHSDRSVSLYPQLRSQTAGRQEIRRFSARSIPPRPRT